MRNIFYLFVPRFSVQFFILSFFLVGTLLISGCTGLSKITKENPLYTGSEIKWDKKEGKIPEQERIELEAQEVITPEANAKFLWMRPQLSFYNTFYTEKEKGFKHWVMTKVGKPPILMTDVNEERVRLLILNRLLANGHFEANTETEIKQKGKTAKITYTATVYQPYRLDSINFPKEINPLGEVLNNATKETLLKKGDPYNFALLEQERNRINDFTKEKGYFYFSDKFIIYKVDSTIGERKLNVYMQVKKQMPDIAKKPYRIRNIYLFPNYKMGMDTVQNLNNLRRIGRLAGDSSFYYMSEDYIFRPEILARSIFLNPDTLYSAEKHEQTLKRLMGLGALKLADIRYKPIDSLKDDAYLDAYIQLVPSKRKSLRAELNLVSKSNNFAGPGLNISYRNKNTFGGAELLVVRLDGRFETQISGRNSNQTIEQPNQQNGLYSYEVGAGVEIYVPRFITPIKIPTLAQKYVPKTVYQGDIRLLSRVNYFKLLSGTAQFGYDWQETATKKHRFNPISINYVRLMDTTSLFNEAIGDNPLLKRSFQNQFIFGGNYSFTYQSAAKIDENAKKNKNHIFFNGNLDFGGNLIHSIQSIFESKKATGSEPYTIFSEPYAQYARADIDFRYYLNFNEETHHKIATRFIAGVGIPYGNADVLPYTKQFFAGGANSIRAFQARSIGPGAYISKDSTSGLYYDQTGDMRLELNVEYRFPIFSIFKGAIFADAGNVWLVKDDPNREGGVFKKENILNDIAVGVGAGLRVDVTFFVLRFDLAFPLSKPWLPENERWVARQTKIRNRDWRKENLVLNIAIGYPF
ncbi:outer membrane protein/protective antigen OMA87 [Bernardetia litoralis DSM 6794]|uniref:Outer membrane protein/protective antigen OMA87 n=1 Tax=Bernardetia litoralis (strain ATCC 23117 / DSM 6794 / NBRC 15988 / NCIMB 1366 / Fx l1 / Sio-4) TaxID=880071 RepID=I4AHU0_BERLS|nr:BamA/TamA family outer membrane protein [Bernardetia litoralis]AFM03525.1 outer membrane protein/protective antigen OMA87 [Bernardetia litoralis DSM 6794]